MAPPLPSSFRDFNDPGSERNMETSAITSYPSFDHNYASLDSSLDANKPDLQRPALERQRHFSLDANKLDEQRPALERQRNISLGVPHKNEYNQFLPPAQFPVQPGFLCVTPVDVLRGRGQNVFDHPGNARFRREVENLRPHYNSCKNKKEKTVVSEELIRRVQSYGGRFLDRDPSGNWFEEDDGTARKKCSQALREKR